MDWKVEYMKLGNAVSAFAQTTRTSLEKLSDGNREKDYEILRTCIEVFLRHVKAMLETTEEQYKKEESDGTEN